ncbi:hypothetical protein [Anaeromyxobacter oryzae]|uniref:Uncharacterized protein n=1 Tax=Anaeromyxobacter oryzae TaxID=2918170 RepID=A0ABM7WTB2_9BACT|nr:hypothetical protein [Anaeromyxobacter oryzae]BDG02646.1 hypothetical protein AMOR_16420 [Anaeromyxobacter oryzae]
MSPLLLALAIAAGAAEHGRVVLTAVAGGGWASDPFVGAGLGGGPMIELGPGARLDLSFSPRLKVAIAGDLSLLRFNGADFGSLAARAGAEARLIGKRAELSLALSGDRAEFSRPVPFSDLAAAPPVTSTGAVALASALRLRSGPVALRAAAAASYRTSEAGEDVAERGLGLDAAVEWPVLRRLVLLAGARHDRVASARPDFARVSTGGEVALTATALEEPALDLAVRGQLDRVSFDTGVRETLSRFAVDVAHPVGPVEAVVAWSWTRSDAGVAGAASRYLVYAGVRGRARALSW